MPSASARPPVPSSLWRDPDFRRLWAGQTASQLGEHAGLTILPLIAVLTLHVDAGQVGALRAVGQAPILLLSLLVGAWVDRWRTATVMVLADLGRALALGCIAVAVLLGGFGLPMLLVIAAAVGTFSVFFDVAYQASLVRLVRREQLGEGNSLLEGSRSAAQIGGPALGGALVSSLSAPIAAASGALFFVMSFVSIARIRRPEVVPGGSGRTPGVRHRIHEGLRFVARDPALRTVGLASAAYQFSFAATMTVYLVFLTRELHLSGTAVGLALAATGPGAIVGSLLAARLPGRFGHGVVLVSAAVVGDGVMLVVPALHGSPAVTVPALIAVNLVFGTFGQLVNVTVMVIRQAVTPDGMQGRVVATINFVGLGLTPAGSLLGGLLAGEWGLRTSLVVCAAGMMLSPVLMALSPLARLGRDLPSPQDTATARAFTAGVARRWPADSRERVFCLQFWTRGVCMARGTTQELPAVADAMHCWQSGMPVTPLVSAWPFLESNGFAEAFERGDAEAIDYRWRRYHENSPPAPQLTRLHPFVAVAFREPRLRVLLPYTSHWTLLFSRTAGYPYSRDCPSVQPLDDGRFLVTTADGHELGTTDAAGAVALVLTALSDQPTR